MPVLHAHRRRVPTQYVNRRIVVGVDREAAMSTAEARLALAACAVDGSAGRTGLRGIGGINGEKLATAFRNFVGQDCLEAAQPWLRIARFRPAFWRTPRPGVSAEPLAEAVMFLMRNASIVTHPKRSAIEWLALCWKSRRMRAARATSLATRRSALLRRTELRRLRDIARCNRLFCRSITASEAGIWKASPVDSISVFAMPRSMPTAGSAFAHCAAASISQAKLTCHPSASRLTVTFLIVPRSGRLSWYLIQPILGRRKAENFPFKRFVSISRPGNRKLSCTPLRRGVG